MKLSELFSGSLVETKFEEFVVERKINYFAEKFAFSKNFKTSSYVFLLNSLELLLKANQSKFEKKIFILLRQIQSEILYINCGR